MVGVVEADDDEKRNQVRKTLAFLTKNVTLYSTQYIFHYIVSTIHYIIRYNQVTALLTANSQDKLMRRRANHTLYVYM
jgi:hypothetical protein